MYRFVYNNSLACGAIYTLRLVSAFHTTILYLDDGTDCYFTCWACIPGIVLVVMIHHPPLHLLLKGVCGHFHPHKRSSALPKICEKKNSKADTISHGFGLLDDALQLLYLAVFQACCGTPVASYSQNT